MLKEEAGELMAIFGQQRKPKYATAQLIDSAKTSKWSSRNASLPSVDMYSRWIKFHRKFA